MTSLPALDWTDRRTRFVLFTGKGGVGKTTVASGVAVALADAGRRVLLVSTDPASNLADIFQTDTGEDPVPAPGVAGLDVMGLDPQAAADTYRDRVLTPIRGRSATARLWRSRDASAHRHRLGRRRAAHRRGSVARDLVGELV